MAEAAASKGLRVHPQNLWCKVGTSGTNEFLWSIFFEAQLLSLGLDGRHEIFGKFRKR